ncbi:hypothetical protein UY3_00481 [Chelonia mydas]|uniref:Uncharacterized protein n=1 Tax=Chelonia mydas TaxID=8469 RepID=M7BYP9_CHEMY|nr:hypothetical protein UY3_00481 [Chelonia mydas]
MVRRKTGERQKKIQSQRIGKGRGKVNRYDVIVESNDKKPIHIRGMLWGARVARDPVFDRNARLKRDPGGFTKSLVSSATGPGELREVAASTSLSLHHFLQLPLAGNGKLWPLRAEGSMPANAPVRFRLQLRIGLIEKCFPLHPLSGPGYLTNLLPVIWEAVKSQSLEVFKNRLDKCPSGMVQVHLVLPHLQGLDLMTSQPTLHF